MNRTKSISVVIVILAAISLWLRCNPKGPVSPQAVIPGTIKHEQNITAYEVWESDKTHIIASPISIDHAILLIKPGATVQFDSGAAISVIDSAGLIADGSTKPIIFSAIRAEKGAWKSIYFGNGALDDSCKLINCEIEYGGAENGSGAIVFCEQAAPTIVGCTISNSFSCGVTLSGDCRGIKFYDNTISNCTFVPVQTYPSNVSSIGNNTYRENGLNQIRIIDGQVDFNDTWPNPAVPYRLADGLNIRHATLAIEPTVELIVEYEEGITVSEAGALQAVGAPVERIFFTASNMGDWKGIFFMATADQVNSKLIHCVIEHGGQDRDRPANIILENASPEISNCLIRQSIGYGMYISGKIASGKVINNKIINNVLSPLSVSASAVSGLAPGAYSGNGNDVIEVRGGPLEEPVSIDGYWDNFGLPYRVTGTVQIQSSTLIFAPGIALQMGERSGFEVMTQGGLMADGSSGLITIEGVYTSPGIWNNVFFSRVANPKNCQLIQCRMSYGGGDVNRPGMIYCDHISPTIRNCTIEHSQTYGIYLQGNAMIADLQSNFFIGNGYGDYFKSP